MLPQVSRSYDTKHTDYPKSQLRGTRVIDNLEPAETRSRSCPAAWSRARRRSGRAMLPQVSRSYDTSTQIILNDSQKSHMRFVIWNQQRHGLARVLQDGREPGC